MLITPVLAAALAGPPPLANNGSVTLPASDSIDVDAGIAAGTATLRPYFWKPLPTSVRAIGGQWVPLGGDGAAGVGTSPVTVDAAVDNGASNGRFLSQVVSRTWCVVAVTGTPDWVTIEAATRFRP